MGFHSKSAALELRFENKSFENKLRWLFKSFKSCLSDELSSEKMINALVNCIIGSSGRIKYWTLYRMSSNKDKDTYGYTFSFLPKDEKIITQYILTNRNELVTSSVDFPTSSIVACVDITKPIISNPIFHTEESMEYWYRSAIVRVEGAVTFNVEEAKEIA